MSEVPLYLQKHCEHGTYQKFLFHVFLKNYILTWVAVKRVHSDLHAKLHPT